MLPFGNRKKYFRGSLHLITVTVKKIAHPWTPEIKLFKHFTKLKIAYFNGKKIL